MSNEISPLEKSIKELSHKYHLVSYDLYDGIKLAFMSLNGNKQTDTHEPLKHILEINYCHKGKIGWKMNNGNSIYLGEHDYSLHTMECCSASTITLPNEYYEGISIYIDLNILSETPPELLKNTGITGDGILNKFCKDGNFSAFIGNEETDAIFSSFYHQPKEFQLAYWRIKVLELLLYLSKLKDGNFSAFIGNEETDAIFSSFYHQPKEFQLAYWRIKVLELLLYLSKLSIDTENRLSEYQSEQVEIVRNIHKYLLNNISQRITIDEIARKYLINTTTLKSVFKAVYGTSIASHIKEHRMKIASGLLIETQKSIKEIAKEIGYESQSKFSKAFKEYYDILPTEYRIFHSNKSK